MEKKEFGRRISELRINKASSARDMSLSIGMSENYINGIENGKAYPSMSMFFYICEYLGISASDFFDTECSDPVKTKELFSVLKGLKADQLEHLIAVAKAMKK